jgi:CGNR zinc finger/Putative stress-induced transcription regulator
VRQNGGVSKVRRVAQAPGELEVLRAFANTLRLTGPVDEIADPAGLGRWLAAHHLIAGGQQPPAGPGGPGPGGHAGAGGPVFTGEDVARAAAFRGAVRGLLAANAGLGEEHGALRGFNAVLDWVGAAPRLLPGPRTGIATGAGGLRGALGRLAAIALDGVNSGRFGRLKLCATPGCRLAFYDHGRNGAGRWCDMAVCGNRAKVAAYRSRRHAAEPGPDAQLPSGSEPPGGRLS